MTPAEELFNETYARSLKSWTTVSSFRQSVQRGMAGAMEETTQQSTLLYSSLLSEEGYGKIILDKDAFRAAIPLEKFLAITVGGTRESTINALDSATILFAHSMVDGAAFDYCRVTALHAPGDWEPDLLSKQVPLNVVRDQPYEVIRQTKLNQAIADLEMESLREKIDRLHARCRPPREWSPMVGYEFDLGRIEALDHLRQRIVHGDALGKSIRAVEEQLDYMNRTCMYFLGLVNFRYGLQIDPKFVFAFMSDKQAVATSVTRTPSV